MKFALPILVAFVSVAHAQENAWRDGPWSTVDDGRANRLQVQLRTAAESRRARGFMVHVYLRSDYAIPVSGRLYVEWQKSDGTAGTTWFNTKLPPGQAVRCTVGGFNEILSETGVRPVRFEFSSSGCPLIATVKTAQERHPDARIRITSERRTVTEQAELMATRIRRDTDEFKGTYRDSRAKREMVDWHEGHPQATWPEEVRAFAQIIHAAAERGESPFDHLTGRAVDISVPAGDDQVKERVLVFFREHGISVLREESAATGPHWHLTLERP